MPITIWKTQSVVAMLEILGHFSTMTQHFLQCKLVISSQPCIQEVMNPNYGSIIYGSFNSLHAEITLPFTNAEINLSVWGQSGKHCLGSCGQCQRAVLHRQCVTRLDLYIVAYQQFEMVPIFSLGTYSLVKLSRFPSYLKGVGINVLGIHCKNKVVVLTTEWLPYS